MTWKSTVFVSGAGVLATWLVGAPTPSTAPPAAAPVAAVAQAPEAATAASRAPEIAQLADRLEQRNRGGDAFNRPARNLFRFAPRAVARRVEVAAPIGPLTVITQPAAPAIHLSGVAMDRVNDTDVWTAILSTPSGVVLAREGEDVVPGVRVTAIGAESVSLTRADGSVQTLPLSGK